MDLTAGPTQSNSVIATDARQTMIMGLEIDESLRRTSARFAVSPVEGQPRVGHQFVGGQFRRLLSARIAATMSGARKSAEQYAMHRTR